MLCGAHFVLDRVPSSTVGIPYTQLATNEAHCAFAELEEGLAQKQPAGH